MERNTNKLKYSIGDSLHLVYETPWAGMAEDDPSTNNFEIIGLTTVMNLAMMGIDFKDKFVTAALSNDHSAGDLETLYADILNTNAYVYIMKPVELYDFQYKDDDTETDSVTDYEYVAERYMINFEKTVDLVKRVQLQATRCEVGSFYRDKIDADFIKKLSRELKDVISRYSDSGTVIFEKSEDDKFNAYVGSTTRLIPKTEAEKEDALFQENLKIRQEQEEAEEKERLEAIQRLKDWEVRLSAQEEYNAIKTTELNNRVKAIQTKEDSLVLRENNLEHVETSLKSKELELADLKASLNERAEKIRIREGQLGIYPPSDL